MPIQEFEIQLKDILEHTSVTVTQHSSDFDDQKREGAFDFEAQKRKGTETLTSMFCEIPHMIIWTDFVTKDGLQISEQHCRVLEAFASL